MIKDLKNSKMPQTSMEKMTDDDWNKLNDFMFQSVDNALTTNQRKIQLCFIYDSEIQNGGHLQYFTNSAGEYYKETIAALNAIGAYRQKEIFLNYINIYKVLKLHDIDNEQDFVEKVLVGYEYEFKSEIKEEKFDVLNEKYDNEYYECIPNMADLIGDYVMKHKNEFSSIFD